MRAGNGENGKLSLFSRCACWRGSPRTVEEGCSPKADGDREKKLRHTVPGVPLRYTPGYKHFVPPALFADALRAIFFFDVIV